MIVNGFLHIVVSRHGFEANDVGPIAIESDDIDEYVARITAAMEGIDFSNITRIRVTGAENGLVVLDAEGRPLRPIIWEHDESSVPDAGWCLKKHDESWWMHEVGVVPTHQHMVTKLSWLHRSEPETWSKVRRVCTPAQYIRWRIGRDTSGPIVATEAESSTTALWNPTARCYSTEVLNLIDGDLRWQGVLPDVRPDGSTVGSLYGVLVQL
jgi:xylulokinase